MQNRPWGKLWGKMRFWRRPSGFSIKVSCLIETALKEELSKAPSRVFATRGLRSLEGFLSVSGDLGDFPQLKLSF